MQPTTATIVSALFIPVGLLGLLVGPAAVRVGGALLTFGALLAGARRISGFWRKVGAGMGSGALAGLVLLGPGLRLAMRVVAITDPALRPEFTLEGTMFIVVFAGALMGAIFGPSIALVAGLTGPRALGGIFAGVGLVAFSLSPDLREELFQLGAGAWMNLPIFGSVFFGYAILTAAFLRRTTPAGSDLVDLTTAV